MNLRATLDDLDVLVDASKPATKDLAPFFRALRPLVADARPTIQRPARADHAAPGPNNDPIELRKSCRGSRERREPAFPHTIRALQQLAAGDRVHPPLHARLRRLAPRLRPGRGELRRQRPLRAHPADVQRRSRSPRRRPVGCSTPAQTERLAGLADRAVRALPGRRHAAAARRLGAVARRPTARSTATPSTVPPGP